MCFFLVKILLSDRLRWQWEVNPVLMPFFVKDRKRQNQSHVHIGKIFREFAGHGHEMQVRMVWDL